MVIITAGMIGVGKTTLTGLIAAHYGTTPFYEPVNGNPVLPDYYKDPKRFAFPLQIYFLNKRFAMIKQALKNDNNVLDRSIYEDALFTEENYEAGNLTETEFNIYLELLNNMMVEINATAKQRPDLMIFADADFDTIMSRIKKRNRDYEQIEGKPELKAYYRRMWNKYRAWYEQYDYSPKIRIDLNRYDLSNEDDAKTVLEIIDKKVAEIRA